MGGLRPPPGLFLFVGAVAPPGVLFPRGKSTQKRASLAGWAGRLCFVWFAHPSGLSGLGVLPIRLAPALRLPNDVPKEMSMRRPVRRATADLRMGCAGRGFVWGM